MLKTLINVMPSLNISFSSNVRKALFMLVVIKPKFCSESQTRQKVRANQRSNRFLNPELISFVSLAHNLGN
jgi:hypothetical protein